jgi:tetratricopeptide (TPR) repeat protein
MFRRKQLIRVSVVGAIAASLSLGGPAAWGNSDGVFTPPDYDRQSVPEHLNTAEDWEVVGREAAAVGDYHNAIFAFDKAIELARGENPELLELRGWTQYLDQDYDAAIADLATAVELYRQLERQEDYRNAQQMRDYIVTRQSQEQLSAAPVDLQR